VKSTTPHPYPLSTLPLADGGERAIAHVGVALVSCPIIGFAVRTALALLSLVAAPLRAAPFPPAPDATSALESLGGAELVLFDQMRAGQATRVWLAAEVRAPVARVRAVLGDPEAYRRAVPSFVGAEVIARRQTAAGSELRVAWELEVPLWNLTGKLWMRPRVDGVDLELTDGDLAPGLFELRVRPQGETPGASLLTIDARANVREANWATRRLAARSPVAEPAMTAAAAWVLLRALVLEAQRGSTPDPRRFPTTPLFAPSPRTLDGEALARAARPFVSSGLVAAAVRSRSDGRLDRVEVACASTGTPQAVRAALAEPQRWHALPGWREIKALTPAAWQVKSNLPFVNIDAVWTIQPGTPFRAQATLGRIKGAVLGWDVAGGPASSGGTVAVFSLHPRLEKSGYIPRRFIEAEPLLEHGFALGLAYVDALSLVQAAARAQGAQ
jgi:hypothetical protein